MCSSTRPNPSPYENVVCRCSGTYLRSPRRLIPMNASVSKDVSVRPGFRSVTNDRSALFKGEQVQHEEARADQIPHEFARLLVVHGLALPESLPHHVHLAVQVDRLALEPAARRPVPVAIVGVLSEEVREPRG